MSIPKIPDLNELQKLKEQAERETLAAYRLIMHCIANMGLEFHVTCCDLSPKYNEDYKLIGRRICELSDEFETSETTKKGD